MEDTKKESNCPFCDINPEKTRILDGTGLSFAVLSNPALLKDHTLVVPKRHVEKISELTEEELKDLLNLTIKMQSLILKKFIGCDIRQNYRPFIRQGRLKIDHMHFHLLPRESEDELYKKSMIFERELFKDLTKEELNESQKFLME